jgi:hypothetical protein
VSAARKSFEVQRYRGALLPALLALAGCAAAPTAAPVSVAVVPCGEARADKETTVLGRRAALVGDTVVVAGKASGAFVIDGRSRRCPREPSVLVIGLDRAGAARFAWCVASPSPFASLAITRDGFAIASRLSRDAQVEAPIDAAGAPAPAPSAEEVAVLRFTAAGAPRDRVTIHRGPGTVDAMAALRDGALLVEGSAAHVAPGSFNVERFFSRVDGSEAKDLEPRRLSDLGAAAVVLVPRPGGLDRVSAERHEIVIQSVGERGERSVRLRVAAGGPVVDLDAAAGSGDDLWLVWSARLNRGEPGRFRRVLARVGANGAVNERALGREDLDAHVYGVAPVAADRAAVLYQVWKEPKQPARFGALSLDEKPEIAAAALVAYDIPGQDEVALAALGDGVTALGLAARSGGVLATGWFRGPLRVWARGEPGAARCGLFVQSVTAGE